MWQISSLLDILLGIYFWWHVICHFGPFFILLGPQHMVNSKLFKKFKNTSSKLCPKIMTNRYFIGYILLETRNISLWAIFELFTTTMGRKIKIWRHRKKISRRVEFYLHIIYLDYLMFCRGIITGDRNFIVFWAI